MGAARDRCPDCGATMSVVPYTSWNGCDQAWLDCECGYRGIQCAGRHRNERGEGE